MKSEIIQMKISIDWIKPEIWRKFIVDSSVSLDDFHDIIQIVMGWTNSHLYCFSIHGTEYMPSDPELGEDFGTKNTKGITLKKLLLKNGDVIHYVYDMGDNWEHTIKIEKVCIPEEKIQTPYCLEGARNCPPEDCGSIPGYEDIVKAMKRPKSKKAKEFIEWLDEPYDPERFSVEEINKILRPEKNK